MSQNLVLKIHPGEAKLINTLKTLPSFIKAAYSLRTDGNLPTGDIAIEEPEGTLQILIERKAKNDLMASVKDGRYATQKSRMKLLQSQGCSVGFIIENAKLTDESNHVITSLVLEHRFFCFHTANETQTASVLLDIAKKALRSKSQSPLVNEVIGGGVCGPMTRKGDLRTKHFFAHQLQLVNSISASRALAIVEQYPNLKSLIKAWESTDDPREMLSNIMIGNTRLGSKSSQKVYDSFWGETAQKLSAETTSK